MNHEDIVKMAREAGFPIYETGGDEVIFVNGFIDKHLARFAALVAAAKELEEYRGIK